MQTNAFMRGCFPIEECRQNGKVLFARKEFAIEKRNALARSEERNRRQAGNRPLKSFCGKSPPDSRTISRIQDFYQNRFEITTFELSRFASPASMLWVEIASTAYVNHGWKPLLVFPNAMVFVAKPNTQLPDRSEIAEKLETAVIDGSLTLQKPVPTSYTGGYCASR